MSACKVCLSGRSGLVEAREMMFGMQERFLYAECLDCGSLQLENPPADLGRFYPASYYSFQPQAPRSRLVRFLRRRWYRHLLGHVDPLGAMLALTRAPRAELRAMAGLTPSASVLDVGAGASGLLAQLRDLGFDRLTGIDPFLPPGTVADPPIRLLRCTIEDLADRFDVIVFNHSLEHLADPVSALGQAQRLLQPAGRVIVRTPIAGETWGVKRENWVELDAPRHWVVFSEAGLRLAAQRAGLRVESVTWDTTGFELWGSALYERGIALTSPGSPLHATAEPVFSKAQLRAWEREARQMNARGNAGRGCFVLRSNA